MHRAKRALVADAARLRPRRDGRLAPRPRARFTQLHTSGDERGGETCSGQPLQPPRGEPSEGCRLKPRAYPRRAGRNRGDARHALAAHKVTVTEGPRSSVDHSLGGAEDDGRERDRPEASPLLHKPRREYPRNGRAGSLLVAAPQLSARGRDAFCSDSRAACPPEGRAQEPDGATSARARAIQPSGCLHERLRGGGEAGHNERRADRSQELCLGEPAGEACAEDGARNRRPIRAFRSSSFDASPEPARSGAAQRGPARRAAPPAHRQPSATPSRS